VRQCARKHQQVTRQRGDFHHKTALRLVREYDVISVEDVQIRTMSRRPKAQPDGKGGNGGYEHNGASRKAGLNTSINDAGWYAFRRILAGKAAWAGKRVQAVPPAYTTQDCSGCGERVSKSLSVRTHVCPHCGLMLDRDANAALNILASGRAGPSGANVGGCTERRLRSPRL
jgi:putative transposase